MSIHFQVINSIVQKAVKKARELVDEGWEEVTNTEASQFFAREFDEGNISIASQMVRDLYKSVLRGSVSTYWEMDLENPEESGVIDKDEDEDGE